MLTYGNDKLTCLIRSTQRKMRNTLIEQITSYDRRYVIAHRSLSVSSSLQKKKKN